MMFNVAVVGGGLVGASLARALDRAGLSCALVEGAVPVEPHPDSWDSRVYALSPATQEFLVELGVWQDLDPRRNAPVREMKIFGDRGAQLGFSAYDSGVERLATIVEAGSLQRALWRSLPVHRRLFVACPARPERLLLHPDRAELQLAGAEPIEARLVVGADGAHSWVREAVGMPVQRGVRGEVAVVANFNCEASHQGTAFQWFREDGVLAWLPLPGRRMSMVWSTHASHAEGIAASSASRLCETVAAAGGARLGALELLTPATVFPIAPLSVPRRVLARVALVGDAAHVIHPLAGQGVNLGFGDARALAHALAAAGPGADAGALPVLRQFERGRAEDILAMRWATGGLQRLFAARSPGVAAARNLGLNLADRLPVFKNMMARRAMKNG